MSPTVTTRPGREVRDDTPGTRPGESRVGARLSRGRCSRVVARRPTPSIRVLLPPRVDLLVLNGAPLELAGRAAVHGQLLFDDDPAARVRWTATTRKIYFDEEPRFRRAHEEFVESRRRGR